jgi:hypothetical protein
MHYITHRSHRMEKTPVQHNVLDALFVESIQVPPEHEKLGIDITHLGRTEMLYVTPRFYRMQKHKFGVMCPTRFLWKWHQAHLTMKNSVSTFRAPDIPECTTLPTDSTGCKNIVRRCFEPWTHRNALHDPQIPPDAKIQVWRNVSQRAFYGNRYRPTQA